MARKSPSTKKPIQKTYVIAYCKGCQKWVLPWMAVKHTEEKHLGSYMTNEGHCYNCFIDGMVKLYEQGVIMI